MNVRADVVREFWDANPCDTRLSGESDRKKYFEDIGQRRYSAEQHIRDVAGFEDFESCRVLEVGCGIGTDGLQFARLGARYVGVDLSPVAVEMSREHFRLFGAAGNFGVANAEQLPIRDESIDHVYSFGVIHHSPDTEGIVREIARVLRPGGTFCVMVYNRASINYYVEIMFLRKLFRVFLYLPYMPALIARVTGVDRGKLERHRELRRQRGTMSHAEWVSANTDGPDCPLSKVYGKREAEELFSRFEDVNSEVCFFDRTHWPFAGRLLPEGVCWWLGRRWGWHRILRGRKPGRSAVHKRSSERGTDAGGPRKE